MKIKLEGCQVTKLKIDSNGSFESAVIKFGNRLEMSLGYQDIWRLEEHSAGVSLFGSLGEDTNIYTLDLTDMDLESEYKHFSSLIGVDYREEYWGMYICSDEYKREKYKRVVKNSHIKEI